MERYGLTALQVAFLYDMINQEDLDDIAKKGIAFTIRSVFVIDPSKKASTAHVGVKPTHAQVLVSQLVFKSWTWSADYLGRSV